MTAGDCMSRCPNWKPEEEERPGGKYDQCVRSVLAQAAQLF